MEAIDPQSTKDQLVHDPKRKRPAEPPRSASRPPKRKRLKTSTFLGYLLFLQRNKQLSDTQERFVLRLQAKVKLEELTSAIKLLVGLTESPRAAARAKSDLELAKERCGRIEAKSIRQEQRRIGVGYRDKGSLRPTHRAKEVPGLQWWSDDLHPALLHPPEEPTWITAEELFGRERYDPIQELALISVFGQSSILMSNPQLTGIPEGTSESLG